MSPRSACLLISFLLGAAISESKRFCEKWIDRKGSITLSELCDQKATGGPLHLRCVFKRAQSEDIVSTWRMTIASFEPWIMNHETIATLTSPSQAVAWTNEVNVSSESDGSLFYELDVVYKSKDVGYYQTYVCSVTGSNPQGFKVTYKQDIEVIGPEDTSMCTYDGEKGQCQTQNGESELRNGKSQTPNGESELQNGKSQTQNGESQTNIDKVEQCCVSSETVRKNSALLEGLTGSVDGLCALKGDLDKNHDEVQTLSEMFDEKYRILVDTFLVNHGVLFKILTTFLSINTVKYDMSNMYNKHIYIVSKDQPTINLKEINNLCEQSNGYLVELDDQEEQNFVTDFLALIGDFGYATGGNDFAKEGDYVYYNSKKPVPENLWGRRERNNTYGREHCVEIRPYGLNGIRCDIHTRYVCELPLI